jgi:hypothetical protein
MISTIGIRKLSPFLMKNLTAKGDKKPGIGEKFDQKIHFAER